MGDASGHFDWSEFWCKCANPKCEGKITKPDRLLIVGLEEIHQTVARRFGCRVRILVDSGNRCREHDLATRRKDAIKRGVAMPTGTGQHALFDAADVMVEIQKIASSWSTVTPDLTWREVAPLVVAEIAETCPVWQEMHGGIGIYAKHTHLDVRAGQGARWDYR